MEHWKEKHDFGRNQSACCKLGWVFQNNPIGFYFSFCAINLSISPLLLTIWMVHLILNWRYLDSTFGIWNVNFKVALLRGNCVLDYATLMYILMWRSIYWRIFMKCVSWTMFIKYFSLYFQSRHFFPIRSENLSHVSDEERPLCMARHETTLPQKGPFVWVHAALFYTAKNLAWS